MADTYLLGVDNGTTNTKATLYDTAGHEIASAASREVKTNHPEPGWAEQGMAEIWQATATAIHSCIEKANVNPADIAGLSLSGNGGGVWLVDRDGQPVRDAIIWLDGRAKPYLDRWGSENLLPELYDKSGWNLFAGMGPVTIFPWLIEHDPDSLKRASVNLTSKDWVKFCLTGEQSTDYSMASVALLDFKSMDYSEDLLRLSGIEEYRHLLPPLIPAWEVAGRVTRKAAEATGLLAGTPVSCGAFDGACSALGSGCYQAGEASSAIGTAGVHVLLSANPSLDPDRVYSLMCYTVPGIFYKTSMTMLAAGNLDWFEREFCQAERDEAAKSGCSVYDLINNEVAAVPTGAGGILYLPLLQGERAPFSKPEARGCFFGLGDWHTRNHLLGALYEGVALSTRQSFECMLKGEMLQATLLSGGGSKSPVWCQILADCLGTCMRVPDGKDSGPRGAAINAGVAVGVFRDHAEGVRKMTKIKCEYQPDPDKKAKYDVLYEQYLRLIGAAWPLWEQNAAAGIEQWKD